MLFKFLSLCSIPFPAVLKIFVSMFTTVTLAIFTVNASAEVENLFSKGNQVDNRVAAQSKVASFETAFQQVLLNHPLLMASESEIRGADLDISAARSGYYPYLQITSTAREESEDSQTNVSVIQPLFRGGFTVQQVKEAKAVKQSALAAYRQTQLDLALATNQAYAQAVASQERVQAWETYYERLMNLMKTIERRVEEGRAPKVDIDSVNIRVTQAEAGLAISESQLFEARSQLQTLTFSPLASLDWPSDTYVIKDYLSLCVTPDCGFLQHPLVQTSIAEFNRQKAISGQRNSERFPTLNLEYNKPIAHSGEDPDETVELQFSYRSDNDLRGYRGSKAQRARMLSAETRLFSARRDVSLDLISTRSRQQATRVQFGAQSRSLKASRQQVQSFIRQYKAGKKTWLEVLNAEREVHQSRLTKIDILASFWVANMRLYLQSMDWYQLVENDFAIPLYARESSLLTANKETVLDK